MNSMNNCSTCWLWQSRRKRTHNLVAISEKYFQQCFLVPRVSIRWKGQKFLHTGVSPLARMAEAGLTYIVYASLECVMRILSCRIIHTLYEVLVGYQLLPFKTTISPTLHTPKNSVVLSALTTICVRIAAIMSIAYSHWPSFFSFSWSSSEFYLCFNPFS